MASECLPTRRHGWEIATLCSFKLGFAHYGSNKPGSLNIGIPGSLDTDHLDVNIPPCPCAIIFAKMSYDATDFRIPGMSTGQNLYGLPSNMTRMQPRLA